MESHKRTGDTYDRYAVRAYIEFHYDTIKILNSKVTIFPTPLIYFFLVFCHTTRGTLNWANGNFPTNSPIQLSVAIS